MLRYQDDLGKKKKVKSDYGLLNFFWNHGIANMVGDKTFCQAHLNL